MNPSGNGPDLFLGPAAADRIRSEVGRARGNEVCFLARVSSAGEVYEPRPVARGNRGAVLAAARSAECGMILIHNHPSGELEPSDPDLAIASELHGHGIGLAITDNLARELYVVVEPQRPREYELLPGEEVAALLEPGGRVARGHPAYEDRPMQRDMVRRVTEAYNRGGLALLEAGTGTGKSIAYLLPAILWGRRNRERTVVSTNTINLQEQLVEKDLPFLRRTLGEPFRFALVKGRHNYISIRRAQLAIQSQGVLFESPLVAELEALRGWLEETRDGSLQDLPFTPSPEVWDEVVSDSDVCLRARCPHFEACYYQQARRDAAAAEVLVVNHHLLFSDLAVRRAQGNYTAPAVLPAYRRVILDEAHNLEDAATSHLGANVSRKGILRLLGRLDRRGRGVLRAIEERLRAGQDDLLQQDALRQIGEHLRPGVERTREFATELFQRLERLAGAAPEGVLRLEPGTQDMAEWAVVAVPLEGLLIGLEELTRGLSRLNEGIRVDTKWTESLGEQLLELEGVAARLRGALESLRVALAPGKDPFPLVRWLERRGGGPGREANVAARAAPIDLSAALRDALWDRIDTGVLTSATLSTRDGFDFVKRRVGLSGGGLRLDEVILPSPFDFGQQTALAIPTDLPVPVSEESAAFDHATAALVGDLAAITDGGVFVLFTSYRSLRQVAERLRRQGIEGRWPLFVQGEAPRGRLIERFTRSGRGVLLGVASFWEGVDVPGHPLRALVIPKLPFRVPSEPLTAARIEAIEGEGGNSFYEYMLPHATLRLKQGFGRLIRAASDRGVVVLLDRRVLERNYGRYFLESLPPAPVHAAPWPELKPMLRTFFLPMIELTAPGGGAKEVCSTT